MSGLLSVARDLLERFPYVHDGWDRLGMVYEARGENRETADRYRKVIAVMREHPDDYDPAFQDKSLKLVAKLDPPSPSDQRWPKVHDTARPCNHNHHLLRAQSTRSNLRFHGHADRRLERRCCLPGPQCALV
jgi:hypothetical protein